MPIVVALVVLVAADLWRGLVVSRDISALRAGCRYWRGGGRAGADRGGRDCVWLAMRRKSRRICAGRGGDWTHELKRDWGGVRVAAGKRLCDVRVGEQARHVYLCGSARSADESRAVGSGAWQVVLDVQDAKHGAWNLPMQDRARGAQVVPDSRKAALRPTLSSSSSDSVRHQIAPARFAADRSIGFACASSPMVSLAYPTAARSAVPKLFRAEPAR